MIAAYCRVSTDDQAEQGISIPAQKSRLTAYCQSQGWTIYRFYVDDGYSGKDLDRPAIQEMIADAVAGKINIVLVYKLDRLSRRQKDVLYLLEDVFLPHEIGFKSCTETFDTTSPFGRAALGMMSVFAQLEREQIVERVLGAKKEQARQGRYLGGPPPFGYNYNFDTKSLEVNDTEAEIVRQIYKEYLAGANGYTSIGETLYARGIVGPRGGQWVKQTIRKVIQNPIYIGQIRHLGQMQPGKHQAIVSEDEWLQAQALMQSRGAIRSNARVHDAVLSGIIYCGECGARMRVKRVWQNYPCMDPKKVHNYYVCYSQDGAKQRNMIRADSCNCGYKRQELIEDMVFQQLKTYSLDHARLLKVIDEILDDNSGTNETKNIERATRSKNEIEKKLERWYTAFEQGSIDPDQLQVRVKDLLNKKVELDRIIKESETKIATEGVRQVKASELIEAVQNFPAVWTESTPQERQAIVRSIIRQVKVFQGDHIEISFRL